MTVVRRILLGLGVGLGFGLFGLAGCPAAKPEFPSGSGSTGEADDGGPSSGRPGASADDGTPGSESTSSPAPQDESGSAPAMLVVDVSALEFGDVQVGTSQTMELVLTNTGDELVGKLGADSPSDPFSFAGEGLDAEWPGDGGDCTAELAGGQSCRIVLSLVPAEFGEHTGSIQIDSEPGQLTVPLVGRGVGSTSNLLVNGDGEMPGAPPPGWVETGGSWESNASMTIRPHGGLRVILATDAWDGAATTLRQDVSLAGYSRLVERGEMRVRLEGWQRTAGPLGDEASANLVITSGPGQQSWSTTSQPTAVWTSFELDAAVPVGAAQISVELVCTPTGAGEVCDAFFDDVSLVLTYGTRAP